MNCREAERHIFADRDGALDAGLRATLGAHVATCAQCRQVQESLAQSIDGWRANTQAARVPDAEIEWQKLRREIRGGVTTSQSRRLRMGWLALPVAAAAAVAIAFFAPSSPDGAPRSVAEKPIVARANIEASVENASPVVFVDEKSGWVFVWATPDDGKHI